MNSLSKPNLDDLVVNICPEGCNNCSGLYINKLTGHRIVCSCRKCNHQSSAQIALGVITTTTESDANLEKEEAGSDVGK